MTLQRRMCSVDKPESEIIITCGIRCTFWVPLVNTVVIMVIVLKHGCYGIVIQYSVMKLLVGFSLDCFAVIYFCFYFYWSICDGEGGLGKDGVITALMCIDTERCELLTDPATM